MNNNQINYFEINQLWSYQQNRWLYYNYFIMMFNFLSVIGLISDLLSFILTLVLNNPNFEVIKLLDPNSDQYVLIYNFNISYYSVLAFSLFFWTIIFINSILGAVNNSFILLKNGSNLRNRKLSYYFFLKNIIVFIISTIIIFTFIFIDRYALFNIPFNNVPTVIKGSDYYFLIITNFLNEFGKINFNNLILLLFLISTVLCFLIFMDLIASFIFIWLTKVGLLKINPSRYLLIPDNSVKKVGVSYKIYKLELKINKLKNKRDIVRRGH